MTTKKGKSDLLPIKHRLRSNQTPAEQLLWSKLRGNQIHGLKFRRQHGIGLYIVDFFCPERALVIEVDGYVHATESKIKNDRQRENNLHSLGIKVIRYNNDEVLHNLDGVLEDIALHVSKSSTSPTSSILRPVGRDRCLQRRGSSRRIFPTKERNQEAFFPVTLQGFGDSPNPLTREFFDRPTLKVAQELLGKVLIRETSNGLLHARIVDVEAYVGPEDKACHASKGRTKRTEIMFGPPGFTYVYLIYGMYYCLNLVTEQEEYPAAILIRGLEVHEETNVGISSVRIDGPGRVCRFLEIDRTDNGIDATLGATLWIEDRGRNHSKTHIHTLPRIGVAYAGEWAKKPWRFCLPSPPSSGKRRTSLP
jgi:DNA-3-methyladenine glycosylase